MITPIASEADAFLAAVKTAVDSDVGYGNRPFSYSKRDAKAYPYQLAQLLKRVRAVRDGEFLFKTAANSRHRRTGRCSRTQT
ncbi:hypothetical protein SB725_32135, partial [Pseudomonas sp. SIMBA_041]|uniref:hypothetical protein n=1 Tax=Pseudomonas sp. SIMBA_041 TaxID=3085782 RepID=UPI00397DA50B